MLNGVMLRLDTSCRLFFRHSKTDLNMKVIKQASIIMVLTVGLFACQNSNKEKELLQKENELLKKELAKKDSSVVSAKTEEKQFVIDPAIVESAFLKFLPNISAGRKLSGSFSELGDLNGDNLIDAVVEYALEPTYEDNGGGGNAIGEISGLVAFINNGQTLTIVDHSEEFGGNSGSLIKIYNGVVFLEGMDYADNDPRCCPSIKTTTRIVLRNNKLVKLK